MTERKLVSVVTGTYNRHDLLLGAIENVRQQTYRPLEHVIVSDGPDPELASLMVPHVQGKRQDFQIMGLPVFEVDVPIRFQELGFWSSGLFTDSMSAAPFMVAQLLARGEYQMWLADDERMLVPDHIEKLVTILEDYDADFAYPRVKCYREPPNPKYDMVIGCNPPRHGQFTHMLYRRDALDKGALFRTHVGSGTDWDACSRLMQSGARWAFLNETTLSHRVDKILALGLTAGLFMQGWL
jgi:GT2 family glycosyltransferase